MLPGPAFAFFNSGCVTQAPSFQNYSVKFTVCLLTVLHTRLVQNLLETYYKVEVAITTIIIHLYLMQLLFTLLNSLEIKLK